MKRTLQLLPLLTLLLISCSNGTDPNPSYKSRGVITGPDPRLCAYPCCGGWFIEIEGARYRFVELPPNSDVRLTETLRPIPVKLSWSKANTGDACTDDVITIHAIARE